MAKNLQALLDQAAQLRSCGASSNYRASRKQGKIQQYWQDLRDEALNAFRWQEKMITDPEAEKQHDAEWVRAYWEQQKNTGRIDDHSQAGGVPPLAWNSSP